jgi:hypothetical protein
VFADKSKTAMRNPFIQLNDESIPISDNDSLNAYFSPIGRRQQRVMLQNLKEMGTFGGKNTTGK